MSLGKLNYERGGAALALAVLGVATAGGLWFDDAMGVTISSLVFDVRNEQLNSADAGERTQNYYGDILQSEQHSQDAGGVAMPTFDEVTARPMYISECGVTRETDDALPWELVPNANVVFKGEMISVNQYGQRDRTDYTLKKPEGTFRIAMAGGSNTMGSGIPVELTFPKLLEKRLNAELAGQGYDRYEVINFSVGGYHLPDRIVVVQTKVGEFEPDLILVSGTDRDLTIQTDRLARRLFNGDPVLPFMAQIGEEARIKPGRDKLQRMKRKLNPYKERILHDALNELSTYARLNDVEVALYLLRREGGDHLNKDLVEARRVMEESDVTVLPLFEAYEGVGTTELWLLQHPNPDFADPHPNREGHRRIADNLFDKVLADPRIGPMLRRE